MCAPLAADATGLPAPANGQPNTTAGARVTANAPASATAQAAARPRIGLALSKIAYTPGLLQGMVLHGS